VFDTVLRAGTRAPTHVLGLQHLFVRPGQRVNIEGTLAVGNFSVKGSYTTTLGISSDRPCQHPRCA
jgi:hypothetical protein